MLLMMLSHSLAYLLSGRPYSKVQLESCQGSTLTVTGSVTLKRIGFFCFPIKHSTHTLEHLVDLLSESFGCPAGPGNQERL
jgi:hypothetical protein